MEDNALNRQVAAELLSSEGARVAPPTAGWAGVQQVLEASVPFDAVLMDMQMPDIDGLEATRRIRADGRFAGLPILAMTANASLADRGRLAAGMNDHVAKPIDKERLGALPARSSRQSWRQGAPATAATRANPVEARAISSGVSAAAWSDRPCVAALRTSGPLRPARTPARRGRCPGQRRDPAYHQGQRFHRWRQRLAGRASELEQALRRADPRRGMEIRRHPPRRTAHRAMPACSACRRCSATQAGVGELNPGAVACPAKDSGGPGARLHPLRPVGRITPWALSADTPEAPPVLPDILFLSFSAFRRRAAGRGR